jgi:hypothetical protein
MKGIENKKWASLSQLKEYLIKNKQKIISFNGICLETVKAKYSLGPDGLTIEKKENNGKV